MFCLCLYLCAQQACHVGAGSQMLVFSKNSTWSNSLSHLLALLYKFIKIQEKLFEDAIHEYTGFAYFYVIPVHSVFLNHPF